MNHSESLFLSLWKNPKILDAGESYHGLDFLRRTLNHRRSTTLGSGLGGHIAHHWPRQLRGELILPSRPPTDRPGAATARQKECGGHGPDLPQLCQTPLFRQDTVKAHLSNMGGPASEASAASSTRFVATRIYISPCAADPPPPPCCPGRMQPVRAGCEQHKNTPQSKQSAGALFLGTGWGRYLQRVAQPRGEAAPCYPYRPFLTTEPRAGSRCRPPVTHARENAG